MNFYHMYSFVISSFTQRQSFIVVACAVVPWLSLSDSFTLYKCIKMYPFCFCWTFGSFPVFGHRCCWEHPYTFGVHLVAFLLCICQGWNWWIMGYGLCLYFSEHYQSDFPSGWNKYTHTSKAKSFICSTSLLITGLSVILILILVDVEWDSLVFICIWLKTNFSTLFWIFLLFSWMSSFAKLLSFARFPVGFSLSLCCVGFFMCSIPDTFVGCMYEMQMFSHPVSLLQRYLSIKRSSLWIFAFKIIAFCALFMESICTPKAWRHSPMLASRSFIVWTFPFRSTIHLESIFYVWCEVDVPIHFPPNGYLVNLAPLITPLLSLIKVWFHFWCLPTDSSQTPSPPFPSALHLGKLITKLAHNLVCCWWEVQTTEASAPVCKLFHGLTP